MAFLFLLLLLGIFGGEGGCLGASVGAGDATTTTEEEGGDGDLTLLLLLVLDSG